MRIHASRYFRRFYSGQILRCRLEMKEIRPEAVSNLRSRKSRTNRALISSRYRREFGALSLANFLLTRTRGIDPALITWLARPRVTDNFINIPHYRAATQRAVDDALSRNSGGSRRNFNIITCLTRNVRERTCNVYATHVRKSELLPRHNFRTPRMPRFRRLINSPFPARTSQE